MSVLGTTKHSSCNQCIDTWQSSGIVLLVKSEHTSFLRVLCAGVGTSSAAARCHNAIHTRC